MKHALGVLATVAVLVLPTEDARACSIGLPVIQPDPWAVVGTADVVFVGTVVEARRTGVQAFEPVVLTFEVEQWIKGGSSARVEVRTSGSSASCGLGVEVGHRVGLVARWWRGQLSAGLGDTYGPDFLRRGALPLPRPTGSGPPLLVAGGAFGDSRLALLDGKARVLRYGQGSGAVRSVAVCPGGKSVVELLDRRGAAVLAVRRLPSLRLVRERHLADEASASKVACLDPAGADALALVSVSAPTATNYSEDRLVRVTAIGTRVLERSGRLSFAVRGARIAVSNDVGEIVLRDLEAKSRRRVTDTDVVLTGLSLSPDVRHVAGFSGESLVVIELARGTRRSRPARGGDADWAGPGRILVRSGYRPDGQIELFDPQLRPVRRPTTWTAVVTTLAAGRAFGIDRPGVVISMSPSGRVGTLGPLFSTGVRTLVALPSS